MTGPSPPPARGARPLAMRLLSDDALVRRGAKGNRRAFEEIYERYGHDLYRFCLAMVGDPQDAQDALQNTMIKVLRALPGESRRIALRPWLYRIARNESVDTLRRRRDSVVLDPEGSLATQELTVTVEARERLRELIGDIGELPERQRAALLMRELSGLGFPQIAAAFDTSEATVRQTVYEARLSLRQMEAGREMSCEEVLRALSDADGRVLRGRELRAHLRGCPSCRAFRDGIARRREDLSALAPLPAAASVALLSGVLGGGAGGGAGAGSAAAGSIGVGAGKVVATTAIAKSAATVAVVAAVGVSVADRTGWIEAPIPGGAGGGQEADDSPGRSSSGGSPAAAPAPNGKDADGAPGRGRAAGDASGDRKAGAPTAGREGAAGQSPQGAEQKATGGGHRRNGAGGNAKGHPNGPKAKGPKPSSKARGGGPPEAAAHGQGTAGAHKAPQGNATPGTPRATEKGVAPPPPEVPKTEKAPQEPQAPPASSGAEAPAKAKGEEAGAVFP
jgi:RNA polymerase sigma factor (sigma-70 family)